MPHITSILTHHREKAIILLVHLSAILSAASSRVLCYSTAHIGPSAFGARHGSMDSLKRKITSKEVVDLSDGGGTPTSKQRASKRADFTPKGPGVKVRIDCGVVMSFVSIFTYLIVYIFLNIGMTPVQPNAFTSSTASPSLNRIERLSLLQPTTFGLTMCTRRSE